MKSFSLLPWKAPRWNFICNVGPRDDSLDESEVVVGASEPFPAAVTAPIVRADRRREAEAGGRGRGQRQETEAGGKGRGQRQEAKAGDKGRGQRRGAEAGGRGRRQRQEAEAGGRGRRQRQRAPCQLVSVSNNAAEAAPQAAPAAADRDAAKPGTDDSGARAEIHPLAALMEQARIAEAHRELLKLEDHGGDPLSYISAVSLKRLRRCVAAVQQSLSMLERTPCEAKVRGVSPQGVEYVWEYNDTSAIYTNRATFDCDMIDCVAALLEIDIAGSDPWKQSARLLPRRQSSFFGASGTSTATSQPSQHQSVQDVRGWRKGMYEAQMLISDNPWDALFMVYSEDERFRKKSEVFLHMTVADLLEEPQGAILVFPCPVSPDVVVPPNRAGHTRLQMEWVALLEPLSRDDDGRVMKFRLTQVMSFEMNAVIRSVLRLTPAFVLKSLVAKKVKEGHTNLTNFCRESKELRRMIEVGNRNELYKHLRAHLAATARSS